MAKIYGYGRCSTNEDRQDVLRQERELKAMGATDIRTEYVSGTKQHKAALDNILSEMKEYCRGLLCCVVAARLLLL